MVQAGDLIERKYRLVREIGRGGMATVWEAEHTTLGSSVAVKLIRAEGRDASALAKRFLDEARAAARVRHRHVVEILDFGRIDDDVPFMVMELMPGRSLEDAIRAEDAPSLSERIRFVSEALSGLAAIHDEGLIHRDLKPANIFVTHDADGHFAKILDFGLSRTMGEQIPGAESMLAGTPEYMSPQQARGEPLDRTTDIYSVGAVLYELLSGEVPFRGAELGELLRAVCEETPPSLRTLPGMHTELAEVVERAMHRSPSRRFAEAREMRRALVDATKDLSRMHAPVVVRAPALSRSTCALTLEGTIDPFTSGSLVSTLPPPDERADERATVPPLAHPEPRRWRWGLFALALLGLTAAAAYALSSSSSEEEDAPRVVVDEPAVPEDPAPEPIESETLTEVIEEPARVEEAPAVREPSPNEMSMRPVSRMVATPIEVDPDELARDPGF